MQNTFCRSVLHPRLRISLPAFSLVELLVVMAIVAILASILIPAMRGMRERSARVDSIARMRALHTAFIAFANDNNGYLPTNGSHADASVPDDKAKRWNLQLADYLGTQFSASSTVHGSALFRPPWEEYDQSGKRRTDAVGTYGYNDYFTGRYGAVKLSQIERPATLPLLGETTGPTGGLRMLSTGPHPSAEQYGYTGPTTNFGPAPGFDGQCNFLFADGRIEAREINDPQAWPWADRRVFNPFE